MMVNGRTYAALAGVIVMAVALHAIGSLADLSLAQWPAWTNTPGGIATGALRLLALALTYYLIGVLVVVLVLGERAKGHVLERLVPYGMLAGLGLIAGVAALSSATAPDSAVAVATSPAPLTLQRVPEPLTLEPAENTDDDTMIPAPFLPPLDKDDSPIGDGQEEKWVVTSGESFWTVAESTLQDRWGVKEISDEDIVSYWRPLIEANEDRLVDPGNPDLLLPDQELILPQPPPRPS